MTQVPTLTIRFKDIEHDAKVEELLEARLRHLAETFHEATHCELTLAVDALDVTAHALVRGRGIDLASHAAARDARAAGDAAIDKLERELRKVHDKRIFTQRRAARSADTRRRVEPS
ncbi:MAG: HPF/RaiA family ribosome-associated protein [Myxococcota bacterium]|nr:HPF/RaiA family ribosome-associated protein [Myxococcales bacterium]